MNQHKMRVLPRSESSWVSTPQNLASGGSAFCVYLFFGFTIVDFTITNSLWAGAIGKYRTLGMDDRRG